MKRKAVALLSILGLLLNSPISLFAASPVPLTGQDQQMSSETAQELKEKNDLIQKNIEELRAKLKKKRLQEQRRQEEIKRSLQQAQVRTKTVTPGVQKTSAQKKKEKRARKRQQKMEKELRIKQLKSEQAEKRLVEKKRQEVEREAAAKRKAAMKAEKQAQKKIEAAAKKKRLSEERAKKAAEKEKQLTAEREAQKLKEKKVAETRRIRALERQENAKRKAETKKLKAEKKAKEKARKKALTLKRAKEREAKWAEKEAAKKKVAADRAAAKQVAPPAVVLNTVLPSDRRSILSRTLKRLGDLGGLSAVPIMRQPLVLQTEVPAPPSLSLQNALDRSVAVSLPREIARMRKSKSNWDFAKAIRDLFPEVTFKYSDELGTLSSGGYTSKDYSFEFVQPVFHGFELVNTVMAERYNRKAAQYEIHSAVNEAVYETLLVFFEVSRSNLVYENHAGARREAQKYAELSARKWSEGLISEMEYLNTQSIYTDILSDYEVYKGNKEIALLDLKRTLRMSPNDPVEVQPVYYYDSVKQDSIVAMEKSINREASQLKIGEVSTVDDYVSDIFYKNPPRSEPAFLNPPQLHRV